MAFILLHDGGFAMQKFSYHTHTNSFGIFDGHNSAAEMIKRAEELGFEELGISNHLIYHAGADVSFSPMFCNDYQKAEDLYKKTCEEIRAAAAGSRLKVRIGFEVDFFSSPAWRRDFEKLMSRLDADYYIGASHALLNHDESRYINIYQRSAAESLDQEALEEFLRCHWLNLIEAVNSGYFAFIAHPDVVKVFGYCLEPRWDEYKMKLVEALAARKQPFELNTSGWNKCGEQHPHEWMLNELQKCNVPIVISDDAHKVEALGQHFERAENLLRQLNYTNRWKLSA